MEINTKNQFSKNLAFFMKLKGVDRNTLSKDLNIKYTTICEWLKGNTMPRADKMDLVAKYFNIDSSDLVKKPDDLVDNYFCPIIDYVPKDMTIDEAQKTHIINATAMLKKNQNQFLIEIVKNFNGGDEPLFYPGNILIFDKNVDKINEDDILYIKRTDHHGEIVINMPDNKSFIFLVVYSNDEAVNKQVTLKYTTDSKDIEILGKLVGVFNPMPKFKK